MPQEQDGFTLIEMLIVSSVVGLLAAIATPTWFGFLEKSRLTNATSEMYIGIREAQSEAQYKGVPWQFSLRESNNSIEWAVHPTSATSDVVQWEPLDARSIQIDDETTFVRSNGIYYVRFNRKGHPHRLGRLTLSGQRFSHQKRCVIVSTLIGAARRAKEQSLPDPQYRRKERFCY